MTTFAVYSPLPFWPDLEGSPLDNGSIHFGVAGQNPVTSPVQAYWDAAQTQPAAQPIKTRNGYSVRNGSPATIFISGDYAVSVYDQRQRLVLSLPSNLLLNAAAALQTSLLTTAGAGFVGHDIALNYATATLGAALTGMVNVAELAGVDRTGVTDCTAAINAATLICKRVYFPSGTYLLNSAALRSNLEIFGDGDATILRPLTTTTPFVFTCDSGSSDPANNIVNIYLHDLQLRGWSDTTGLSEHLHLVSINGVTNARFERVTFRASRGDGVYVGSSNTPATERHNFGVTFHKCHFDGVDHSNRNGITIVDCTGLNVDDCLFENLTHPTMPGAIDVEPNPGQGFAVQRDLKVRNCRFYATGGTGGWFSIQIGNISPTTPISGILLEGNTIDSMGYTADREKGLLVSIYGDADSTRYPLDFKASDNTFRDVRNLVRIDGASDLTIKDNRFLGSVGDGQIGLTYHCLNLDFDENILRECGSDNTVGGKCITFFKASFLGIRRNRFINCGKADGTAGIAMNFNTGASDNVAIEQNTVTGVNATAAVAVQVGHTLSPATNVRRQNAFGALDDTTFLAAYGSVVYNPPSLASGTGTSATVSAPGARVGRPAYCAFSVDQALVSFTAYVDSADSITVLLTNRSAGTVDLPSGTLSAWAPLV